MQAYAEGFDILRNKDSKDLPEDERFTLNLPDIAEVWRRGSVISSWLLDLGAAALAKDPQLKDFSGFVQDSGEGRWTIEAAIEEAVPARRALRGALRPFPLAPGAHVRRKDALGHALRLRRAYRGSRVDRTRTEAAKIAGHPVAQNRRGIAPCPTNPRELDSAASAGGRRRRPATGDAAGRSLRHGDLRRRRRPDQAPGDARALQPVAHQGAAREIRVDRRGPRRRNRRKLARGPSRHAEELRRECRGRVRHRPDRRGCLAAAWEKDVLHPWRPDRNPSCTRRSARHWRRPKRPTAPRATSSSISPSPTGSSAPWWSSSAPRS